MRAEHQTMERADDKIYSELGGLTRKLDLALRTMRDMEVPLSATSAQLPKASDHLSDLAKLTEDGTHRVMALTEGIQDNRLRVDAALGTAIRALAAAGCERSLIEQLEAIRPMLAADDKRLIDIMTALSFQDLVAQRVKKLITILDDVEHKLLEMLVVFGAERAGSDEKVSGRAEDMLHELEASRTTAIKQDLVDDILGQFGFA
ncbi:MAG TPA: protein phosphatase CheZ [Nitrospirales bacterium]|nr:protein phosphatase CheZ [Nitrospirales bacterium]